MEKRTLPSSFLLPVVCDCDPGGDLFGKRDGIVPPARRTDRPRPIVESWQFPFSAAFYGKKERALCFCTLSRESSLFKLILSLG